MVLVTGATGTIGAELVKALTSRGEPVRAIVRNPKEVATTVGPEVEIVQGDLGNPDTYASALKGVEKAFLLSPASPQMAEQQRKFVESAKRAGVKHIVRLSILPADPNSPIAIGRWHGKADQYIIDSGIAYTSLRPAYLMQNQLTSALTITSQGAIYGMLGDGRVGHIDGRDVAEAAATVLTSKGHEGKVYPLTGPESLSMTELTARLAAALGKKVKYVNVTPDKIKAAILGRGEPESLADGLVELYTTISQGMADILVGSYKEITGRNPRSIDQFALDYASAFERTRA